MFTIACCMVVRLELDLVSGWLVVITHIFTTFGRYCHIAVQGDVM